MPAAALQADALRAYRRELALSSLEFFGAYYFPHYISNDIPPFHREIIAKLADSNDNLIVYWPRDHSKTTWVSLIYPIWNQVKRSRRYQMIFSETDKQSTKILRNIRRAATNANGRYRRLVEDFGYEIEIESENGHELIFAHGGQIACSSHGSSDRGSRDEEQRPDLVIGDDIENMKTVATGDLRDKTQEWWEAEVVPMLDPATGRAIWVGTMLHEDAAMAREAASGGYEVIRQSAIIEEPTRTDLWDACDEAWTNAQNTGGVGIKAAEEFYEAHKEEMDEGAVVLWKERHNYFDLWCKRRLLGSLRFSREYQSDPASPENLIVHPDQIHNFRMEPFVQAGVSDTYLIGDNGVTEKLSECSLYIAIDPAISQKTSADYFALSVMAAHPHGSRWFIDLVRAHLSFADQIRTTIETYADLRRRVGDRVISVGVETVAYQRALLEAIATEGSRLGLVVPTRELRPVSDKIMRLTRHQPAFEQGLIYMQKTKHAFAVSEICGYSRDGKIQPRNDDAMDAVVYNLMQAEETALADEMYEWRRLR